MFLECDICSGANYNVSTKAVKIMLTYPTPTTPRSYGRRLLDGGGFQGRVSLGRLSAVGSSGLSISSCVPSSTKDLSLLLYSSPM